MVPTNAGMVLLVYLYTKVEKKKLSFIFLTMLKLKCQKLVAAQPKNTQKEKEYSIITSCAESTPCT